MAHIGTDMDLKRHLRRLAPQLLRDLYNRSDRRPPTWDGVYSSFAEVPRSGPAFEGRIWLDKIVRSTEEIRSLARDDHTKLEIVSGEYAVLPLLASAVAGPDGLLSVLDFGGGLGRDYLGLLAAAPSLRLEYNVVEVSPLCERGRELHHDDAAIRFHPSPPHLERRPDIINLHGSLQFVEAWREVLRTLVAYQPRHFLFVHLPAGDMPTFASAQRNVEGSFIPCWFFALPDILEEMRAGGYRLAYRAAMERSYDMRNFPSGRRLKHPCNLLFTRSSP